MVRKLSSANYRFRVVNAQGYDILEHNILEHSIANTCDEEGAYTTRLSHRAKECTRVQCDSLLPASHYVGNVITSAANVIHGFSPDEEIHDCV